MNSFNYDVLIIGAGPGGYVTAERLAKLGMKTAIVEKNMWGGVCLNVGCIPTKTLLKTAKVYNYINHSHFYGLDVKEKALKINWDRAMTRKNEVVKKLTSGVQYLMKTNKVDMLFGQASAIDKNTIKVTDDQGKSKTYTTKYLIIATGSKVKMFDMPNGPQGLSSKDLINNPRLLTSTEILSIKEVPKTLTIIGGGVIGVEFAQLFSTLGTKVTIIEYLDKILALLDHEISTEITKVLTDNGVKIVTGHSVNKLKDNELTYYAASDKEQTKPLTIKSDYFLLSTGRMPITTGFDNLKINIKRNGAFSVNNKLEALDDNNQVISNLYVIGDANGEKMLAHVASAQGLIVANNILACEKPDKFALRSIDYQQMPNCIYTFPEVASVGLTESEVKASNTPYLVKKLPFANNGKSLADGETTGFIKIIVDKKYGQILGAHMVGATATDLIAEIVNMMSSEATIIELADSCHPHPTFSELIMDVANDLALNFIKK